MMAALPEGLRRALWPYGPAAVAVSAILGLIAFDLWRSAPAISATNPVPSVTGTIAGSSDGRAVVNYTIFQTVTFGGIEIVTGTRFDQPDRPPTLQYCYASTRGAASTRLHLELARRVGSAEVVTAPISDRDAVAFGIDAARLHALARDGCRFASIPNNGTQPWQVRSIARV